MKWQQKFSYSGLAAGHHTMVIQVLGTMNAASSSTKVAVDAFKIYP